VVIDGMGSSNWLYLEKIILCQSNYFNIY